MRRVGEGKMIGMKNLFERLIKGLGTDTSKEVYRNGDFSKGDLCFDIVSLDDLTCRVIADTKEYSGTVEVPGWVEYNGRRLKIVDIGLAFHNNRMIAKLTIPESVMSLQRFALAGCERLKSLVITDGEKCLRFEPDVLSNCNIETLYLGRDISWNTEYTESPFSEKKSLREVSIGAGVKSLNGFLFYRCKGLKKVRLSESINHIHSSAFAKCENLETICIPDSVTILSNNVFKGCTKLKSITLGRSQQSIGKAIFDDCPSLESITSLNHVPPHLDQDSISNKCFISATLYVPKGAAAAYKADNIWSKFWRIEEI